MAGNVFNVFIDCIKNNRPIKEINGKICLGGKYYSKDTESTFPIKQLKRNNSSDAKKFYTLGEICYFWENRERNHVDYVKKAQERNMRYVSRPDRKPLLKHIDERCKAVQPTRKSVIQKACAPSTSPAPSTRMSSQPDGVGESEAEKLEMEMTSNQNEKVKVRTYSRNRSSHSHELRMSSRRHSSSIENQSTYAVSAASKTDISDELSTARDELLHLGASVKNLSMFLKDYMGLNKDEVQALQDGICSSDELANIASHVKNNIVHASMSLSSDTQRHPNISSPKFCYQAVRHPTRGWEMVKEDLSSVLSGEYCPKPLSEIMDHRQSAVFEEGLTKATAQLKRAFSVIISQMREFNKPLMSHKDSDKFCRKIVKDCLVDAVDRFRDIFSEILSSEKDGSQVDSVEKWVDLSRAELGKLFQSLAMTLQSLRDIPTPSQSPFMSLFHFPEPTFSLALNPAKVTHNVVLEMYVRIGLAELRRILMSLMGLETGTSSSPSIHSNGNSNDHDGKPFKTSWDEMRTEGKNAQPMFSSVLEQESMINSMSATSDSCESDIIHTTQHEDQLRESKSSDNYPSTLPSTSCSLSNICVPENSGAFEEAPFRRNGRARNRNSPYQTRRLSESDYCQYNMFKASLGNTLVSSFKKQIQEKIQASGCSSP